MELTPAILLRKAPWSETSLIVTWLTERFGTVRTLARGARKADGVFAGKLDIFFREEIGFSISRKSGLHALREAEVVSVFDAARAGTAGFYLAAYFAELAGMAAPAMHPAPEIFSLLARGIDYLQRGPASVKALEHFEKELCGVLGVHDATGSVTPVRALASLCGEIPRSRVTALSFLQPRKNHSP